MKVQLFWIDGRCTEVEISISSPQPHEIIVLRGVGMDEYFRLDAGRYIQCKSVIFV